MNVIKKGQHLFSVLKLLLLALWHEVIQPAHLPLGEDTVHQLPDEHQSQHLQEIHTAAEFTKSFV